MQNKKREMRLKQLLPFLFITFNCGLYAQSELQPADNLKQYQENYKWRIEQSSLVGQYIPKDLPDAINELNKLTDEASREKFKRLTESDAEHKLYFSLGRWVATNWSFYEGSRLSHYLKEVGITFPEDQAVAVIIAWHRTLNKKEINFKEIRDRLVEKRKKEHEERLRNKQTVIKEEIKKTPNTGVKN
jgi:hypothetical protein